MYCCVWVDSSSKSLKRGQADASSDEKGYVRDTTVVRYRKNKVQVFRKGEPEWKETSIVDR